MKCYVVYLAVFYPLGCAGMLAITIEIIYVSQGVDSFITIKSRTELQSVQMVRIVSPIKEIKRGPTR